MPNTNGHGPKRAILYARVSTDEQARSVRRLVLQRHAEEEAAGGRDRSRREQGLRQALDGQRKAQKRVDSLPRP